MSSRPVKIQLMGQSFTIRTSDSDEHVAEASALVNNKLTELRKMGAMPDKTIGLLAALTLADELVKVRRVSADLRNSVREEMKGLIESVKR